MALINHRAREIHFKIVYYGPGLGGKTTNLRILHDRLPPERRGKMISIATDHERTLFFDFLPLDLGQVNGFSTRFHLYTVPGQVYYRLSRRAVLQGVDGVVFVADSHPAREEANRESLMDLGEHLGTLGLTPAQVARLPRVFQYNKRDLPGALPVERMHALLNPGGALEFEAVASDGRGVNDTLKAVCKLVLGRLTSEPAVESTGPMPILVMRRPGKAQMAKMAADAAAAEAAATSRSESAAVAAGTLARPVPAPPSGAPLDRSHAPHPSASPNSAATVTAHAGMSTPGVATVTAPAPPGAPTAQGAVASAPHRMYPPRPVIAPPRPMQPRPMPAPPSGVSPAAMRPASPQPATPPMPAVAPAAQAATKPLPAAAPAAAVPVAAAAPPSAAAASAPAPARPAPPMPTPAAPAPARPASAAAPAPAPPPAAPAHRSLFRWPWPARIASRPGANQAPAPAAASAAPVPASTRQRAAAASAAPLSASTPQPLVAPAPVSVAPVAAPPRQSVAPAAASAAPVVAPVAAPVAATSPPRPAAPPMAWGRPPRPANRRGGLPGAGARPVPSPPAAPRPANAAAPLPASGPPARPDSDQPTAEARALSPATEPA